MFYMIKAEHMNTRLLDEVVQGIEDNNLGNVYAFGMDSEFTGFANMIVETTESNALLIRELFWERNGGAFCAGREPFEEEMEDFL